MGDDLGFKGSTFLDPVTIPTHIFPQYKKGIDLVHKSGKKFRNMANGYGLGSGNSIPDYIPPDSFRGMIDATKKIRRS